MFDCVKIITLANDDPKREIPRAIVRYPPLYRSPPFQTVLDRFRQGELLRRGADHIVHNVGLLDAPPDSEYDSAELVAAAAEDAIAPGALRRCLSRPVARFIDVYPAPLPVRRFSGSAVQLPSHHLGDLRQRAGNGPPIDKLHI